MTDHLNPDTPNTTTTDKNAMTNQSPQLPNLDGEDNSSPMISFQVMTFDKKGVIMGMTNLSLKSDRFIPETVDMSQGLTPEECKQAIKTVGDIIIGYWKDGTISQMLQFQENDNLDELGSCVILNQNLPPHTAWFGDVEWVTTSKTWGSYNVKAFSNDGNCIGIEQALVPDDVFTLSQQQGKTDDSTLTMEHNAAASTLLAQVNNKSIFAATQAPIGYIEVSHTQSDWDKLLFLNNEAEGTMFVGFNETTTNNNGTALDNTDSQQPVTAGSIADDAFPE
jgi:hypothetical protein